MKVTVCFGPVSVVVPCGNGDILVRDLISQAVARYRKASNKPVDATVSVTALRSSDGAILDPDDRLADVVDDREQLAACLAGETDISSNGARLGLNLRGDGTSASSNSGSPSPDFLHHHYNLPHHHQARKDIEVTGQEAGAMDLHLQVRRGSEPALNRISPGPHNNNNAVHHLAEPPREYKRWSAAPIVDPSTDSEGEERTGGATEAVVRRHASGPRFARSGARVSMQIFGGSGSSNNNGGGYRWAEAADNALLTSAVSGNNGNGTNPVTSSSTLPPDYEETMHRRTRSLRREPVGATSETVPLTDGVSSAPASQLIVLPNEGGPLGIHVVPDYSPLGNEMGLLVQGVEAGGRIHRDGRIAIQDRIIEINSHPLKDVPFHRAQELFRNALQSRDLRLRIVKPRSTTESRDATDRSTSEQQQQEHSVPSVNQSTSSSRVAAVSPTRKTSAVGTHVPGTGRAASALMTVSTRKIGKKLDLELIKGPDGLGFSVTTRDNPAGGLCPIYIKNILPKGAAIEDGRLRSGDRLLDVNGLEITGKSQSEVVALLRNIPTGGQARLLISRQEVDEEPTVPSQQQQQQLASSPKLPRQMKPISSQPSEESLLQLPWKQREYLVLDIPVHDTEKAGLGISVKGKTTSSSGGQSGTTDLGIFIKSVLHGGAASRDGRLCTNDQLLHVNGVSLLGRSNTEAMEGLRRAVHQEGPKPGHITLTIARKVHPLKDREAEGQSDDTNGTFRLGGDNSSNYDQSGGSSDQSGSTVIFVSGSGQYSGSDSRERNLVKDRLSGLSDLRNESYYRATHDTWNTTQLQESVANSQKSNFGQHTSSSSSIGPGRRQHSQNSPTVHLTPGEVVSIDGDYLPQSRPRPPSMMLMTSNGSSSSIISPSTPDSALNSSWQQNNRQRSGPTDGRDRPWTADRQPQSPSECSVRSERPSVDSDAPTYASQTSLEEAPGFSRDQFGRQSMSEKRHASLDAKSTDTYQRNKKLREERERQKQEQQESEELKQKQQQAAKENVPPSGQTHDSRPQFIRPPVRDIGPTLGLKKSSSLESLQTVVQEITMQEDPEPGQMGCYGYNHRPTAIRVVRGRGCNESFRAAVDRSYDDGHRPETDPNKEPMETLDEEAAELNEMMAPVRSPSDDRNVAALLNNKGDVRKSQKKKNGNNAAGLLLRGLGSMFRFGKHRKSAPSSPESSSTGVQQDEGNLIAPSMQAQQQEERRKSAGRPSDVDRHHVLRRTLPPDERDRAELGRQMALAVARQAAQDEQKRIQHHYLRLMEQQQRQQHQTQQTQQQQNVAAESAANRSQRLHQLRAQHQQKRPTDPPQRQSVHAEQFDGNKPEIAHGRSASYDPYNDVRKPRSRAAVGEPNTLMPIGISSSSSQYNNNYDDFQINRRQQHYHSQRSARETRTSPPSSGGSAHWTGVDRPVSNYFEYESLHIAGHTVALSGPPYKPQQQQQQQQHVAGRRIQPQEDVAATYFRRHERSNTGQEYGPSQGRASQRESVYGATTYGGSHQQGRPAPLAGSKV